MFWAAELSLFWWVVACSFPDHHYTWGHQSLNYVAKFRRSYKKGAEVQWLSPPSLAEWWVHSCPFDIYSFLLEHLSSDWSLQLPSTTESLLLLPVGMRLLNNFEEKFSEDIWSKLERNVASNMSQSVVALASFSGNYIHYKLVYFQYSFSIFFTKLSESLLL